MPPKKITQSFCAPGLLCIQRSTLWSFVFIAIFIGLAAWMYTRVRPFQCNANSQGCSGSGKSTTIISNNVSPEYSLSQVDRAPCISNVVVQPNYGYTNLPNDILRDPYAPPLRDDRYMVPTHDIRGLPVCGNRNFGGPTSHVPAMGVVPINVSTQAIDTEYRQIGILKQKNGNSQTILPLMGRPLFTNRDKWQFYTINDKYHGIKLPIRKNGRSCTNEYGCDNLYNGDEVVVEGYDELFLVTAYDNNTIKYLPFV